MNQLRLRKSRGGKLIGSGYMCDSVTKMIKRYNIKELELAQDEVGAWYYTLNNTPYTGCAVQYYNNGVKAAENYFVDGYQDGVQCVWFQNGQLKMSFEMKNNIYHGIVKSWFECGILKYEAEYNMGEVVWSKKYNEQGELIKELPLK